MLLTNVGQNTAVYLYNMDIECPKQFAAATRLSFTIRQESIEEVMEAMSLIAPIRYEIKKNKVYITPRK